MKRLVVFLAACSSRTSPLPAPTVHEHPEMATTSPTATTAIAIDITDGLAMPETVVWDPDQDIYFISNMNGDPAWDDDNGYISKVSPNGEFLDRFFIDGRQPDITLHAPRGMVIGSDTLYVADNHAVRLFDRKTGKPTGTWEVPGSVFLNDLAIDDQGHVLVTETGIVLTPEGPVTKRPFAIYRFDDGKPVELASGDALHGPNGIENTPEGMTVIEFMGSENGVFRLGADGHKDLIATLPTGELDGLARMPDGSLLVTSWEGNGVYRVVDGKKPVMAVEHLGAPAGIAYDSIRNRILIPLPTSNEVLIQPYP
ncbi:MAG: SMP-30/gluconolactonase/LRE family protein [Deltaproteobacteria bacterium]|nr:SMP-30/gluconolactonase/LRE family protein [Deltaproteobacteria bacterium]